MQVEVASYLFLVGLFGLKAPPAYILAAYIPQKSVLYAQTIAHHFPKPPQCRRFLCTYGYKIKYFV